MKLVDIESPEIKYLVFYTEILSKLRSDELLNLKHLTPPPHFKYHLIRFSRISLLGVVQSFMEGTASEFCLFDEEDK